jgi:polysaccharide biosynthesis transport protein
MDDFQKYLQVAYRRKWSVIAVFGSVIAASILFIVVSTPIYEAGGQLLLRRSSKASSIGDIGEKLGQLDALGSQSSPVITEIEVIRSMPIGQRIITELNLTDKHGVRLDYADFSKALRVTNTKQTDVVEVAFKDANREQAAAIVNKLFELYIQNDISNNREEAQAARVFIEKQLPQVEETVKQAELYLREFKEANGVIDLTAESRSAVETVSALNQELFKVKSEMASITVQSESLKQSVGINSDTAFLISSPSIQQVLGELQQIGQKIAVEKARYRDENPVILDLRQKQSSLMRLLE